MEQSHVATDSKLMPNEVPLEHRAIFLEALAATGNVTEAARSIGVTRHWAYQLKWRDEAFARDWKVALDHRRQHLVAGIDAHIESHIEHDWEPKLDAQGNVVHRRGEDGELLLDDDLEPIPVMVSTIGLSALTQGRRSLTQTDASNVTNVAVQTNFSLEEQTPRTRPRLVMPVDVEDADFEEIDG